MLIHVKYGWFFYLNYGLVVDTTYSISYTGCAEIHPYEGKEMQFHASEPETKSQPEQRLAVIEFHTVSAAVTGYKIITFIVGVAIVQTGKSTAADR